MNNVRVGRSRSLEPRRNNSIAGRRQRRLSKISATVGLGFAAGGLALGLAWVPPSVAASSASPLERGLAFYKGKTVTFVVPQAPGGSIDQQGRDFAQYMAAYLHATVNVENIPQANGVPGQDAMAAAPPTGLTIGIANPPADVLDVLTNINAINFNLEREVFIVGLEPSTVTWVVRPGNGITNFKSMIAAPTIPFLNTGQGITDMSVKVVNAVWGGHARFITGFAGTAAILQGYAEDEGIMFATSLASVGALIQGGQAIPILTNFKAPSNLTYANLLANTPDIAQEAKLDPPKGKSATKLLTALEAIENDSGQLLIAPSKTPKNEVVALRAAAVWAGKNVNNQNLMLSQGLIPGTVPGATAKANYLAIFKTASVLTSVLES